MEKDVKDDKKEDLPLDDQDSSPDDSDEDILDDVVEIPEGEDDEGQEDKPVPKETFKKRLDEVIGQRDKAEEKAADAERARLAAEQKAAQLAERSKPKVTRELLRNAVEQGIISQVQSDETWDVELIRRAKQEAKEEARYEFDTATKIKRVDDEIGRYRAVIPSIVDRHSQERILVEQSYSEIIERLGPPKTDAEKLSYELTALRETFGKVDKLENRKPLQRPTRLPNRETGGGKFGTDEKNPIIALDNRSKRYYAKMIEKRVYKNWEDVRKELEWKRGQK